jgi:hypothetical protein
MVPRHNNRAMIAMAKKKKEIAAAAAKGSKPKRTTKINMPLAAAAAEASKSQRTISINMAKAVATAKAAEEAKVELEPTAAAIVEEFFNNKLEEVHIVLKPNVPIPPPNEPLPVKVKRGFWATFWGD